MTQDPFHLIADQGLGRMPAPDREQYVVLFEHGTLEIGMYAPRRVDQQTPHSRDEVYLVFRGSGWFRNGPHRTAFAPGDVLFVPARQEHRFEEFTDDFSVWVFFYGPEGGEEVTGSEE